MTFAGENNHRSSTTTRPRPVQLPSTWAATTEHLTTRSRKCRSKNISNGKTQPQFCGSSLLKGQGNLRDEFVNSETTVFTNFAIQIVKCPFKVSDFQDKDRQRHFTKNLSDWTVTFVFINYLLPLFSRVVTLNSLLAGSKGNLLAKSSVNSKKTC